MTPTAPPTDRAAPTPPAAPTDPRQAAEARISAAQARIAEMRREALSLDSAYQSAMDAGDDGAMADAEGRLADLQRHIRIAERVIGHAHITLGEADKVSSAERLAAAAAALDEAIQAENAATQRAMERRTREHTAHTLTSADFYTAVRADVFDETHAREQAARDSSAAREGDRTADELLRRAQDALHAHRRRTQLTVDKE